MLSALILMVSFDQKNFLTELIIKQHAFNKNSFRNSLLFISGKRFVVDQIIKRRNSNLNGPELKSGNNISLFPKTESILRAGQT